MPKAISWPGLNIRFWGVLCAACMLVACGFPGEGISKAPPPAGITPVKMMRRLEVVKPVASCESLMEADLAAIGGAGSKIISAKTTTKDGIDVCEAKGLLAPEIQFTLLLPVNTWTQRYLQSGCGGLCGRIYFHFDAAQDCLPLQTGEFAMATTDMGHDSNFGDFGKDPQKRIDFAYRGVHLTAQAAKSLILAFYGQAEKFSYFTGCSDGGREALVEAQRYPDDFNGIVAGSPALNFSVQNSFYHAWQALSNRDEKGREILTAERLPVLHKAVLAACDGIDGLVDGLITDPRACRFDPASIQCENGRVTDQCLTAAEVAAARKLYDGPKDPVSGVALTIGGPMKGSELAWSGVFVQGPWYENVMNAGFKIFGLSFSAFIAKDSIANIVYETNPENFKLEQFEFTATNFDRIRPLNGLYAATNPDLHSFQRRGGKLILWHGWSDPHISPMNTIAYYEAVESLMGADQTGNFVRLYLPPGMYHCGGGAGPSNFDLLVPMMNWVEANKAPDEIQTYQVKKDKELRVRPMYPYPQVAVYNGFGSKDAASSFHATQGQKGPAVYEWAGKDFMAPGNTLYCNVESGKLACARAQM
jgi:feruloyl esterase